MSKLVVGFCAKYADDTAILGYHDCASTYACRNLGKIQLTRGADLYE